MRGKIIKILLAILLFTNIYAQDFFWEKTNGPYGGIVYSVLTKNNTLFIGTKGGVYRSDDLGDSWIPIGLQSFEVTSLAISKDYLIAISSAGCFRIKLGETDWVKVKEGRYQTITAKDSLVFLGSECRGVYRSKNCGLNWEQVNNGIDNFDIEKIHITSSNVVLASAAGTAGSGVFRSLDSGDNWTRIDPYQYAWNFHGIAEVNNVLFAFDFNNNAKVYKSTDNGLTWFLPKNNRAPSDIINSIYADNSGLYVGVYHNGFFYSSNEGAGWTKINNGLENLTITSITGNSSKLFLSNFDGFYKSAKKSIKWKRNVVGLNNLEIYSISQNSEYLFVGTNGSGLFRAKKDLSSWEKMNLGNNNKFITSILALDNVVFVLVSSWTDHCYQELYVSLNNGVSWKKLNPNLDSAELKTIVGNNNVLFVGSGNGVFRSKDGGNSWKKMGNGMPNNINCSSIAVYDSVVIVTDGTADIYRSEDMGESWSRYYVEDLFSGKALAVSSDGNFYLGSCSVNQIFKSYDLGKSWTKLNNPLYNSSVNSIAIDDTNIYCGLSKNGIIKSTNNGESWFKSNLGLLSKRVKCISVKNNNIFIGTNSGLYKEVNLQTKPIMNYSKKLTKNSVYLHWKRTQSIDTYRIQVSYDSLFQSVFVDQIITDTSYFLQSLNYMTTYFWRVSIVTPYLDNIFSKFMKIVITNPVKYELYNNYPNPFNNETNIRIDVPYNSKIKLILYNSLGEKIKTIEESVVKTGSYNYKLKSNDLASGIYFVRLIGNNFSKTIKVVLLK